MSTIELPTSILTKNQKKSSIKKKYIEHDITHEIQVNLRYDDDCNNGHNSFAITAKIIQIDKKGIRFNPSYGCLHDDIRKHFPEYSHLIKWHLCSSDGPLHYIANSIYHASTKDCWGKEKSEPYSYKKSLYFNNVPIPVKCKQKLIDYVHDNNDIDLFNSLEIVECPFIKKKNETYDFNPHYTFKQATETLNWYDAFFSNEQEAIDFKNALLTCTLKFENKPTAWGEGKEPDLNAARSSAIWPEAELKDFTKENLEARLPALMYEFKKDMEDLGFVY